MPDESAGPLLHEPGPHWGEVGIHGLHRPRRWDAVAVVEVAFAQGHAGIERPKDLVSHVRSCMYDPTYPRYV